jgi:prepilin-type N-terminal cleavage/methylation domain-containing protein
MFIAPHKKLNKRGFTLVELTMVMAITAIISVMIVSFSTLISAQTRKNNLRADFLESVMTLRTDLQKAFAENNYDYNTLPFNWEKYEYIDDHEFDTYGKIIKVTLTNKKLSESQSFTLISKVG